VTRTWRRAGLRDDGTVPSAARAVTGPYPPHLPGPWKLAFDSTFDTTDELDTTQWSTGWYGGAAPVNPSEQQFYSPEQVSVGGGELRLTLEAEPTTVDGTTKPYVSGMVTTLGKYQFTYGYVEARILLPATPAGLIANWPAFWLDGQPPWPTNGEIDVLEGLGGYPSAHFHYQSSEGEQGPGFTSETAGWAGEWHAYAANWQPGVVTFYYDGAEVWQQAEGVTDDPMFLCANLAIAGDQAADLVVAPATMRINFVRVWQHPPT